MPKRITWANLKKLGTLASEYRARELFWKVTEKLFSSYKPCAKEETEQSPAAADRSRPCRPPFAHEPMISIVVPTYETPELFLRQMIDSVLDQTYENWELCIADGSKSGKVERQIQQEYGDEKRIRYQRLEKNGGISENTNEGVKLAQGEYLALLDHDDLLAPAALCEMVQAINETGADFLYSDEDKVSADRKVYGDSHWKTSYNAELLLGNNYICHFLVVKKDLFLRAGGLDSSYDGAQDFDLVLRLSEQAGQICHVPKILYHWRIHAGSTAGNTGSKRYAYDAGKHAIEAALARRGYKGCVTMETDPGFYHVDYAIPAGKRVCICLGDPGKQEKLGRKLASELVAAGLCVVGSEQNPKNGNGLQPEDERRIQPETAEGAAPEAIYEWDYLLLVGAGVRKIRPGSASLLLGSCGRADVGIAGGRTCGRRMGHLSRRVLQCGYFRGRSGLQPRFRGLPAAYKGYFKRADLAMDVDGVSPDFAVIAAEAAEGIIPAKDDWAGFCRTVREKSLRIVTEPRALADCGRIKRAGKTQGDCLACTDGTVAISK